jgi:hypothetical protein
MRKPCCSKWFLAPMSAVTECRRDPGSVGDIARDCKALPRRQHHSEARRQHDKVALILLPCASPLAGSRVFPPWLAKPLRLPATFTGAVEGRCVPQLWCCRGSPQLRNYPKHAQPQLSRQACAGAAGLQPAAGAAAGAAAAAMMSM